MSLASVEQLLQFSFPRQHRAAMLNPNDPVHNVCDFLVPESPYHLLRLVDVNQFLRNPERPDPWPSFLIAFASNGCGDYFAYDLRGQSPEIIYVDPDHSVHENLSSTDRLAFSSFEVWYASKVRHAAGT